MQRKQVDGKTIITFASTLLSVSDKTFENVKGTQFRVANIEFINDQGVINKCSATIWEKNFNKGMPLNQQYHTVAEIEGNNIYVKVAPFAPNAERATLEMFGYTSFEDVTNAEISEKATAYSPVLTD